MPEEEWDETMPLPGDIIEAVAAKENQLHRPDSSFLPANGKSELSSQLGQLHRNSDLVWLQVRRGNVMIKLQARIVIKRESKLHRKYTVQALGDERHVAILDDLTLDECANLQEMSRKVINVDTMKLNNKKSIKYDWRKKAATHLPDHNTTIISSILFVPFPEDGGVEKITGRSMAWFSAAVSSGVPLVFVNIQTEEISIDLNKERQSNGATRKQKLHTRSKGLELGVRLWFLPGIAEVPITLAIMLGETRFGMDIKRTEEGFMFISSVSQGTAAERAGLGKLWEEASESGHLVVISRLEEKSLIPSSVTTNGLIQCCDHASIKLRLAHTLEDVHIHVMAW
ncbi:PDZ domain-containing protein, partial [Dioscorea alata]